MSLLGTNLNFYCNYSMETNTLTWNIGLLHVSNRKQDGAASESSSSRDIRHWSIDVGHWILELRHWTLEFGLWLFEFGH